MKVTIAGSADVANLPSTQHDGLASFHGHLQISNMDKKSGEKRQQKQIVQYPNARWAKKKNGSKKLGLSQNRIQFLHSLDKLCSQLIAVHFTLSL